MGINFLKDFFNKKRALDLNIINQEVQNNNLLDLVYSMYSNRILNENLINSQLYKNITVSGKNIKHTIDIYIEFVQMNNLERTVIKIIESNDVKKLDIYEFDNLLKDLGFFPKGIIYFNGRIDDEAVIFAKKRGIQVIKFDINKELIEDIKKSIEIIRPNHEVIGDPFWILMQIDAYTQENTGNYLISHNHVLLFTSKKLAEEFNNGQMGYAVFGVSQKHLNWLLLMIEKGLFQYQLGIARVEKQNSSSLTPTKAYYAPDYKEIRELYLR